MTVMADAPTRDDLAKAIREHPEFDPADIIEHWESLQKDDGKARGKVTTVDDLFTAASEAMAAQPEAKQGLDAEIAKIEDPVKRADATLIARHRQAVQDLADRTSATNRT